LDGLHLAAEIHSSIEWKQNIRDESWNIPDLFCEMLLGKSAGHNEKKNRLAIMGIPSGFMIIHDPQTMYSTG
jgi:hypothetical protein